LVAILLLVIALQLQRRQNAMTHPESASPNQIQSSLAPMLRMWTRSIGWTIVISTVMTVLFALLCDGCSGIH
jgi:hypothetical protein